MLFSSYQFIFIFLPLAFSLYFFLNKLDFLRLATLSLALSSLFFYGWWNIKYLPLILFSILVNYLIGILVLRVKVKQLFLVIGILFNLLLLGYFKYSDFFIQNINYAFNGNYATFSILLPLAISFFTFQQIAYLVDSYKGYVERQSFLTYLVFVTFFPQLIAGPIVHHKEMMPQFNKARNKLINYKNIYLGILIFTIGLFKKVFIADSFAIWATNGFDLMDSLTLIEAWVTSLSYTFQLYFDFSGYTDMALGIALLFNIRLPINFNSPYKSTNIRDFWKRWHITLSRFLRDYIYIPLGGSRRGEFRLYTNLLTTFLIGGLWHGAGWTFVFWGAMHGFGVVIHRFWSKLNIKINNLCAWFITFNFINLTWIFFRAENWEEAIKVLKGMFGFSGIVLPVFMEKIFFLQTEDIKFGEVFYNFNSDTEVTLWILIAFYICLFKNNSNQIISENKPNNKSLFFIVLLFTVSLMHLEKNVNFIYFNF
ncbi:MBOAT family O-acyltransferase [Pseudothioglobus sp. nBUS_23]|uniref:MBOAT family O-acyltransferase n=1 Tax=Pseudothioglobus sp. nBUS_23 TaxID=3395318 RepID=UPI003EBB66B8